MALYTAQTVRANIRNREGRRVFYLGDSDRLTPGARDFLRDNHIDILPAAQARPQFLRTAQGAVFQEKPENMTHLNSEVLVPKTHPRILFRGLMDTLEGILLLAQKMVLQEGFSRLGKDLGDCLALARQMLAADVLEEPLPDVKLGGLDAQALRERSHTPQKYYDQPHFMPDAKCGWGLLLVNHCRTAARQAELAACKSFQDMDGRCTRPDLVQALNRMSSFLWILEIRLASGKEERHGNT